MPQSLFGVGIDDVDNGCDAGGDGRGAAPTTDALTVFIIVLVVAGVRFVVVVAFWCFTVRDFHTKFHFMRVDV